MAAVTVVEVDVVVVGGAARMQILQVTGHLYAVALLAQAKSLTASLTASVLHSSASMRP